MDYFFYIGGLTFPNNKSVLANYVSVQLFAWIFYIKGLRFVKLTNLSLLYFRTVTEAQSTSASTNGSVQSDVIVTNLLKIASKAWRTFISLNLKAIFFIGLNLLCQNYFAHFQTRCYFAANFSLFFCQRLKLHLYFESYLLIK